MGEVTLRDLSGDFIELLVHVGLMGSVMSQFPPHVQHGFQERLVEMREWTQRQTTEIQEFGSAYDEG